MAVYSFKPSKGGKASGPRRDVHAEITNKILAEMRAGTMPWLKPWSSGRAGTGYAGMPRNAVSKRRYSGINIVLLWSAALEGGYSSPEWLTFKQAIEAGGSVRKGEKGTHIIFMKRLRIEEQQEGGETEEKDILMARTYVVFNVEQCDGLKFVKPAAPLPGTSPDELDADYMATVAATGAKIEHGGDQAFYAPALDFIRMPKVAQFKDAANYMATLAHELIHWSGHKSRLDRITPNDKKAYAFEELIAEFGAAFTCGEFGIRGDLRHPGYIEHWLRLIEDDKRVLFRAASRASKAVAHLYPDRTTAEDHDNRDESAPSAIRSEPPQLALAI